jgi:hypothetical protein
MKVTSQLHALATLALDKELAVPTGVKPLNIPNKIEKNSCPFRKSTTQLSFTRPITLLDKLSG